MVERLASPAAHELDALTDLWERSVRVTHDFLAPEDIPFFRRMVRQEALPAAEIYVIRDSGNGFAAFAGIGADRIVSRDALDPSGRPYPILHLER